jgi:hypothetical protein
VLGTHNPPDKVPQGRPRIPQDEILGWYDLKVVPFKNIVFPTHRQAFVLSNCGGLPPYFLFELVGVDVPHAAFLTESHTREPIWCLVQEIRVANEEDPPDPRRPVSFSSWFSKKNERFMR